MTLSIIKQLDKMWKNQTFQEVVAARKKEKHP